ncbi:hypothetical protein J2W83_003330, partial [Pseudomonas hunanensis]|nr:hypothetical protein [Pseudomonas hunanensis]
ATVLYGTGAAGFAGQARSYRISLYQ